MHDVNRPQTRNLRASDMLGCGKEIEVGGASKMARCSILFAFCSTVVCVLPGSSVAQTTVVISDSSGNETHGRISGGHVYLYDSNGNQAFGTVRDGHVFL